MTDCIYCNAVKENKTETIYEDEKLIAFLAPKPATDGHIILLTKKHYQIFEQLPDYEAAHVFKIANKLSTATFESLQAHGTNIVIQNGVPAGQSIPHFSVHIIPRKENDHLNLQWNPRQLTEEQMSTVELMLREGAKNIGAFEKEEKKEPLRLEKKAEKIKEDKNAENYLIRQLERIP